MGIPTKAKEAGISKAGGIPTKAKEAGISKAGGIPFKAKEARPDKTAGVRLLIQEDGVPKLVNDIKGPLRERGVFVAFSAYTIRQRRNDAEIHVHRLKDGNGRIRDIECQCAYGSFRREVDRRKAQESACGFDASEEPGSGGFHITLHACHLAREGDSGVCNQSVIAIQESWGIQECIPVHHAETKELRVMEGRDHRKDAPLFREAQMGLESDEVINAAVLIILAKLNDGERLFSGPRVFQSARFQGAVAKGFSSPSGHDLHRHTALKDFLILKAVDLGLFCGNKGIPESVVLFLTHRAIDVISGTLIITRPHPGEVHIDTFCGDQWSCRVKEVEGGQAHKGLDRFRQRVRSQGSGSDDHGPVRDCGSFSRHDGDSRMGGNGLSNAFCKAVSVNSQCASSLHAGMISASENQGIKTAKLLFQETHSVFELIAAQRIRTAELREEGSRMSGRFFEGFHFKQRDLDTALSKLPGRLGPSKSRADDSSIQKDHLPAR